MAYGFTLHEIVIGGETIPIGVVRPFGDEFKDLVKVDAVRVPTSDELELYRLSNPELDETPKPEKQSKKAAAEKAAAEKAAAEKAAAGGDGDPEVVEGDLNI